MINTEDNLQKVTLYLDQITESKIECFNPESFYKRIENYNASKHISAGGFEEFISPYCQFIENYLPPVNLYDLHNISLIADMPAILIRDGLLTLLDFFHRFPSPPSHLKTIFCIHENFQSIVPLEWVHNIAYYRFHFLKKMAANKTSCLLIKGIGSTTCFSKKFLSRELEIIKTKYNDVPIYLYMPIKKNPLLPRDYNDVPYYFFEEIYSTLKIKPHILINHHEIMRIPEISKGDFLDLNEGLGLYTDDYINCQLLNHSCYPVNAHKQNTKKEEKFFKLSPFHGYVFSNGTIEARESNLRQEIQETKKILGFTEDQEVSHNISFIDFALNIARTKIPKHVYTFEEKEKVSP